MSIRRRGREIALQVLYQLEWDAEGGVDSALTSYVQGAAGNSLAVNDSALAFGRSRIEGVLANVEDIDQVLRRYAKHWRLDRMASVDRNILRLGVFELLHCPDIPPRVVINEAVELAKTFGSENSGAFVNGILDAVLRHLKTSRTMEK
jgi:N utilization substance protein B